MFEAFIERWQEHNEAKFEAAQGMEATGVMFDGAWWKPLSPEYMAEKRKDYDDWLMVRDGDLIESLTNPGASGWYEEVTDTTARFGTLLKQATFNWESRPVMFLDQEDAANLRGLVIAHLEDRAPFANWVPPAGKQMDAEFHSIMDPLGVG